jgi:hypothetical protein
MVKKRISMRPELVQSLDTYGYSALHYAAQHGHESVVLLLLEMGAPVDGTNGPNGCGATPLHRSAFNGHLNCCRKLVEYGASLDACDVSFGDGRTALQKAASQKHDDVIQYLLEMGANSQIIDSYGMTLNDILRESHGMNQKSSDIAADDYTRKEAASIQETQSFASELGVQCMCCTKIVYSTSYIRKGLLVCLECKRQFLI